MSYPHICWYGVPFSSENGCLILSQKTPIISHCLKIDQEDSTGEKESEQEIGKRMMPIGNRDNDLLILVIICVLRTKVCPMIKLLLRHRTYYKAKQTSRGRYFYDLLNVCIISDVFIIVSIFCTYSAVFVKYIHKPCNICLVYNPVFITVTGCL